ncbi:hypothetical protein LINGRAHAP2_LOCUS35180, partial [Linum grandiflorum]
MAKPPDASTTTLSTRAYFGEIAPDTEPETYSLVRNLVSPFILGALRVISRPNTPGTRGFCWMLVSS